MRTHLHIEEDELTREEEKRLRNEDPITGAPGAHPLGVGVGAVAGGLAGAALGAAVAGPVGMAPGAGLAAGVLAGGLVGRVAAEEVDPTVEDAYWRERHPTEAYAAGESYELYEPAYRAGYEGFAAHHHHEFADVEEDIRKNYAAVSAGVPWDKARPAAKAAWDHLAERRALHKQ